MDPDHLRETIAAFDPDVPIERAWTPPSSWYTAPAVHDLERLAVWGRSWLLAAFAHEVADPGTYVASVLADQPVVVVRGDDGVLRAFHNVCRHKAAEVCQGAGRADVLECPYHGWRYRLDGTLRSAPKIAGIEDFDPAEMGLRPLRVETWGPWVLVNAEAGAPPVAPDVDPLTRALDRSGWADLAYHGARRWEIACNWKVFCDNYLDGGYHVPHLHPSLDKQLDMKSYRTEVFERFSLQTAGAGGAGTGRIGEGALYAFVYPNLMINRYGPVLDINVVWPTGPERCVVDFHWWFAPSVDPAFVERSVAQSAVTQDEDVAISDGVQRGLRSEAYTSGRYAPRMEVGIHHFHRLLATDLRRALEETSWTT